MKIGVYSLTAKGIMSNILNYGVPAFIIVIFVVYFIYQIFFKEKNIMTNKELIDYCIMLRKECIGCPYNRKECYQFFKETYCSPWMYAKNDKEFLNREVGKNNGKIYKCRRNSLEKKKDGKRMVYKDYIDNMLCADVRPNIYGKNLNDEFFDTDQFICSECGLHLQDWEKIIGDGEIEEFEFNYCPNCGAIIRGETE